ncbi:MAG: hypothetical protein A2W03_15010 [Candidatus Aminicenantes bacterium RBG_16_63_16]|nr:MAG: hypothetical protein A2W03_15010 [Candidatus Aminicenantes bacterium RBG_16_63_16]
MKWPDVLDFQTIRGKLFVALTGLVLAISLLIYLYFPKKLRASTLEASLDKIQKVTEMIAYSIAPAMDFKDTVETGEVINNARQNKDLRYIMAYDRSNELLKEWRPDPRLDPAALNWVSSPLFSSDRRMVHLMQPVMLGDKRLGKIILGFSLEELQLKIKKTQRTMALVSLAVFVAGILIIFGISTLITTPLHHLSETVDQISQGDLTRRSRIESADEVGRLSASFNAMVDKLEMAKQEMERLNLGLEIRVLERTKDLQKEIQERKLIEQEVLIEKDRAEAANRAKSEFLASMSHELRTPLNAIIGFSQVLGDKIFGELNDKQVEYIKDIEMGGEHLLELINDILDIAKVEAGKMELDLSRVEIKDFLEHCFVMIKEKCAKRRIGLDLVLADNVNGLEIRADARKVKQVMYNLLSNASKFTPEGGRISVEARQEDKRVVISVQDTGIGIEPEHLEKVFEEFYQIVGGTRDKTPGTGLGLALARKLVELHGGRIWAESGGRGQGSRFSFELPAGDAS